MPFTIKPATPVNDRLLIGIVGPQGSGKTTSALLIATGITKATGGKICVIDTENKRALQYAKNFKFNHLELDPPFSPERYDEALQFAQNNGYGEGDVIIVDSASHEHEGPGGVLEMHQDFIDKRTNNSTNFRERDKWNLLAWAHAKKGRKRLISNTLQRIPCHVILCFRAKESVEQKKIKGKTEYVKTGLIPIGADEYFYEMAIAMVLPKGAAGKPDWKSPSSRINEYGDGPIKQLLYNTEQLSEGTGEALAAICSVGTGTPQEQPVKTDQWTEEEKTKHLAAEIVRKIKACNDGADLQIIVEDYDEDLADIKDGSQAAYDYVMNEYDSKRLSLGA